MSDERFENVWAILKEKVPDDTYEKFFKSTYRFVCSFGADMVENIMTKEGYIENDLVKDAYKFKTLASLFEDIDGIR